MGGRAVGVGATAPRWFSAPLVRHSWSANLVASRVESRGQAIKLSGEAIVVQRRCGVGLLDRLLAADVVRNSAVRGDFSKYQEGIR
uniref:OSJNBb0043H09.4 protein n=1 Tax=Oryza sativa subsp. japonica TaxID=39947 RepID=Q7XT60_ORYSJ|nr:OSJNBb0043H09.4 [Oryza sativa Japonica Group]